MILKPFIMDEDNIIISDKFNKMFDVANVNDISSKVYVLDGEKTLNSFRNKYDIFCPIIQVVTCVVKDFPNIKRYYDSKNRTSLVKFIYLYNGFFDSSIVDIEKRFYDGLLRLEIAVGLGYTDSKLLTGVHLDTISNLEYNVSIFNMNNNILTNVMYKANTNKTFISLDICDPRSILVSEMSDESVVSIKSMKDRIIKPNELDIDKLNFVKKIQDITQPNEIYKMILNTDFGSTNINTDVCGVVPIKTKDCLNVTQKINILKYSIEDMIKPYCYSLFDEFDMIYETGKKSGFRKIKSPIKQFVVNYMEDKCEYIYNTFIKICKTIETAYGPCRITLSISDYEHIIRCRLINNNELYTIRLDKLEIFMDYISTSLYSQVSQMINPNNFKREFDLDYMKVFSSKDKDGNIYVSKGEM